MEATEATRASDVVVVGAGVNGLVCALVLAQAGLGVTVVEGKPQLGGGARAELPFAKAPRLPAHAGAHRLGFVPRDLLRLLGVALPLRPRDPSVFAPTTAPGRFLLAGSGPVALSDAVMRLSPTDARGLDAMHLELDAMLEDLAPAWLGGPLAPEDTADRFVRPKLRDAFVALCRGSLTAQLDRFGVGDELVRAFFATDVLAGAFVSPDEPGSAAPLLVRHAARTAAGGADAIATGGAGALVKALADAAQAAGVTFAVGSSVAQIAVEGNTVAGVVLRDGSVVKAETVVCSADPFQLRAMVGDERLSTEYVRKIDGFTRAGSVAKVSLALAKLPCFTSLREDRHQHEAAVHLLPGGDHPLAAVRAAFADVAAGRIPSAPPIVATFPTAADPALRDPEGRHQASLLVPWAPYDPAGTTWAAEEDAFLRRILTIVDSFAPETSALVVDAVVLHPKKLESLFGVTRGLPSHVDDALVFGDRLPYPTPIPGLYACGAGCAPAGGIFGVAGHNAAKRVLADLELGLERTEVGRRAPE